MPRSSEPHLPAALLRLSRRSAPAQPSLSPRSSLSSAVAGAAAASPPPAEWKREKGRVAEAGRPPSVRQAFFNVAVGQQPVAEMERGPALLVAGGAAAAWAPADARSGFLPASPGFPRRVTSLLSCCSRLPLSSALFLWPFLLFPLSLSFSASLPVRRLLAVARFYGPCGASLCFDTAGEPLPLRFGRCPVTTLASQHLSTCTSDAALCVCARLSLSCSLGSTYEPRLH